MEEESSAGREKARDGVATRRRDAAKAVRERMIRRQV